MRKCLLILAVTAAVSILSAHSKKEDVKMKDFELLKDVGRGAFGYVFAARKIGGKDDGAIYALKAVKISKALKFMEGKPKNDDKVIEILNSEVKFLKDVRDIRSLVHIEYAFCEGDWLIIVTRYAPGGNLFTRLIKLEEQRTGRSIDVTGYVFNEGVLNAMGERFKAYGLLKSPMGKYVLAEIVVALKKIHDKSIGHRDIKLSNIFIDSDGHIIIGDFGFSFYCPFLLRIFFLKRFCGIGDWMDLSSVVESIIPFDEPNRRSLIALLEGMQNHRIAEIQVHSYFTDVDWKKVEQRTSPPPFEVESGPLDIRSDGTNYIEKYGIGDGTLKRRLKRKFKKFSYVAPEHQVATSLQKFFRFLQ